MTEPTGANWLAYMAILAWPFIGLALYKFRPYSEATAWTILGALLLLPTQVAIKFQMIPAIDKNSVGNLSILIGCTVFASFGKYSSAALGIVVGMLAAVYIGSPVLTSLLNGDLIIAGSLVIPGVDYYDGVSALLSQSILFIPFFVGRRFLAKAEDIESVLRVLVLAGLAYSLPMLFEIRMSPQLSAWIYGAFASSYAVEMRYGGFRPVVFMSNGLASAFFLSTAFIAAAALWRARTRISSLPQGVVGSYLGMVLILCKSAGALVYGVLGAALVRWVFPKVQVRVAVVLVAIAISYPVLRTTDYFPTDRLVEFAAMFNQDRADSLKVRFEQEQRLLAHASERFWFGWGRYGRNRVYDRYGKDISLTDGQWIITFGQFGFVGFLAQFGLMTLPVFYAARASRWVRSHHEMILLSCLSLILAITAVEQLPNASISPWTWLLAGTLLGRCQSMRAGLGKSRNLRLLGPAAPQLSIHNTRALPRV